MRAQLVFALLLLGCSGDVSMRSSRLEPPPVAHDSELETRLAAVSSRIDGLVAVSVRCLPSGARASIHGSERLPMMSVFKLPLAVVALSLVEEGRMGLDNAVPIAASELRPGISPIAKDWERGEHAPKLGTLLERVLIDSDNTAGDKLVTLEGGGAAVTRRLRELGMAGIDIAEQEIEINARLRCPGRTPPAEGWTFPAIDACPAAPASVLLAAAEHEVRSAPNGATSDALVEMLARLDRGDVLTSRSRAWLWDTLARTQTGSHRLKALLPAGARVEHRTGTGDTVEGVNVATNDVGVLTTPRGERIAIAVLVAGSRADEQARERVIAELGRTAFAR
jgi:beta-lactamase class A